MRLTYNSPCQRLQELLDQAGIPNSSDASRGFDHGTFVPMMLAYPQANIPAVQLSLKKNLDPSQHLAIGRALQPLRDEGVFVIGSGLTYHNVRAMMQRSGAAEAAEEFSDWLVTAVVGNGEEQRGKALEHWIKAPSARVCHPREDHLLPLMVAAGAAGADAGALSFDGKHMGVRCLSFLFG